MFDQVWKNLGWPLKALGDVLSKDRRFIVARPPCARKQILIDKRTGARIAISVRDKIDRAVVKQMFVREDYDLESLTRHEDIFARYEKICAAGDTPLIIDAGANIGASCLYFAAAFPKAHIIGIEPEPGNFRMATENCRRVAGIELVQAGIANSAGHARISNPAAEHWGFQTEADPHGGLSLIAINDLVASAKTRRQVPFLVKIDVEGFEENIFASNTEWVDETYVLIIELHDWMLPGRANSGNFLRCIAPLGRDFVYRAENVFSIKNGVRANYPSLPPSM